MFSKYTLAAGLISSTYAQSVSTVYQDVYAATTTLTASCNDVCTTSAVTQSYTVVVSQGMTSLVGSSAPTGATAASAAAATGAPVSGACGFQLAINGTTSLQQISDGQIQAHVSNGLGQIADGQVQSGSGLTDSSFTISDGMVYDQAGRICSISGQGQAQFQCNYVPTTGSVTTTFSLSGGNLAFDGSTQFYACLLGGANDGYNIYQSLTGVQNGCSPVTLAASGSTDCETLLPSASPSQVVDTAASTPTPSENDDTAGNTATPSETADTAGSSATPTADVASPDSTPAASETDDTSDSTAASTTPTDSAAATMPVQSATGTAAIFTGAASQLSTRSVMGVVVAGLLSYLML